VSSASSLLIVVPTLNSFQLLPRLLSSLQNQSWPSWSLLFVDGPSTSEHRQWLEACCELDSRLSWLPQDVPELGIFGAMNQGFDHATSADWLLFWGSDDWAPGPDVLAKAIASIDASAATPDLIVCRGRYVDPSSGTLQRSSEFRSAGLIASADYRRSLMLGSTPPHQATLIGPGARRRFARYHDRFRLSGDLDYFLQLSRCSDLSVQCLDLELVHMSVSGVSSQQTLRRLQEVRLAYSRAFPWRWWIPFTARYIRRLASLFPQR